jgi:hypothetical protein
VLDGCAQAWRETGREYIAVILLQPAQWSGNDYLVECHRLPILGHQGDLPVSGP